MAELHQVSVIPAQVQVQPGESTQAKLVVRNRSEEVGHYRFSTEGLPAGWCEIVPDQAAAFPFAVAQAQILIHPPLDARSATYHLSICATLEEGDGFEGRSTLDIDVAAVSGQPSSEEPAGLPASRPISVITPVAPTPGQTPPVVPVTPPTPITATPPPRSASQIEVEIEAVQNSELPPPARQWRLTAHNAGRVLDEFGFSVSGIKPGWITVEPAELTLEPDARSSALLTVRPTSDTRTGAYRFTVRTYSHLNFDQGTEIPLLIEVRPRVGFKLSVSPHDAQTQGPRDFTVRLTSIPDANTDLWIDLSASDEDNRCEYIFDPVPVLLPARQAISATLHVRPPATLDTPDQRATYTIVVTAEAQDKSLPPQQDTVRLTQVATQPANLNLRPKIVTADLSGEYTVVVANPSGIPVTLFLAAEDPEGALDFAFQPARLDLPAGSTEKVMLTVTAPEYYDGEGQRTYPITVTATRDGSLLPTAKVDGSFVQRAMKPITLELTPQQQSRPGRAAYRLRGTNPRKVPVEILLEASDEADALQFALKPNLIRLAPGAAGQATLNVAPKDRLQAGEQRRVHRFTVTGRANGTGVPVPVKGTLAQVRGLDLGPPLLRLIAWMVWLIKWAIFIAALILLVQVAIAGIDHLADNSTAHQLLKLPGIASIAETLRYNSPFDVSFKLLDSIMTIVMGR